jgi:hypothetical protein
MIRVVTIKLNECTCERCGAVWIPRPVLQGSEWITLIPIACSMCKSSYWNRPKQEDISRHGKYK